MSLNFKEWFLNEISNKILKKIGNEPLEFARKATPDRHFHDVFGGKLRVVIPLTNNKTNEFAKSLKTLGASPNFQTGMATVIVKTQRGDKEQQKRIGAFINDKIKTAQKTGQDSTHLATMLNWWEKNKSIIDTDNKTGVSIIISRSPIDLVRMSDHDEWHSCHAPDGSYFRCALQEAKTGGAVAYIVRNKDLEQIKDLQAPDIFKDQSRKIPGIEPLERLRLRRFQSKDKSSDILIPEKRVYGTQHVGFVDAVENWAKETQKNILDKNPQYDDYDLRGGTYKDNSAHSIWNKFLGTDHSKDKTSIDKKQERKGQPQDADYFEERAQKLVDQHSYTHYLVWYDVQDDGDEPYLYCNSSTVFDFPDHVFIKELTDADVSTYGPRNTLGTEIKDIMDEGQISNISVDGHGNTIRLNIDFESSHDNGTLDGLEHLLDDTDTLEEHHEKHHDEIWRALREFGFVKKVENHEFQQFRHFKFEEYDQPGGNEITSEPMWVGNYNELENYVRCSARGASSRANFVFAKIVNVPRRSSSFSPGPDTNFSVPDTAIERIFGISHKAIIQYEENGKLYFVIHTEVPLNSAKEHELLDRIKIIDQHWDYYYKRAVAFVQESKKYLDTLEQQANAYRSPTAHFAPAYPEMPEPAADRQKRISFPEWFDHRSVRKQN